MPQKLKNIVQKKGSVLIFTLVVMFTIIVIALGIASVTSIEKKNSLTSNKSVTAFQVADSGSEVFMNAIKNQSGSATLGSILGTSCNVNNYRGNISGGNYEVTFFDASGNPLDCNAQLSTVDRIKSVGTYQQTTRAVDIAMAAGLDSIYCTRTNADRNWPHTSYPTLNQGALVFLFTASDCSGGVLPDNTYRGSISIAKANMGIQTFKVIQPNETVLNPNNGNTFPGPGVSLYVNDRPASVNDSKVGAVFVKVYTSANAPAAAQVSAF